MNASFAAWTAEFRALLKLGRPIILTNLAQIAIGATDTLMMGRLGSDSLAAGALAVNLYFGVFLLGMGLVSAVAPMLAQLFGGKRHMIREGRRAVRQGLWVSVLFCLPTWPLLWRSDWILAALGQDPALIPEAASYVRAMMWGMAPALMVVVLRCFVSALERPRSAMIITFAAIGLNVFVNWLLMFGNWGAPAMGVAGAGVASSTVNAFMACALLGFVLIDRRMRRFHLLGNLFRPDWDKFREILRLGVPMGLAFGFEVSCFNVAAFLSGLIDARTLAAYTVTLQAASITFMVPMGLGQAATVRVGLAAGAGDAAAVRRAGWAALAVGIAFMTCCAAAMALFAQPIAALFLDMNLPGSVETAALAASFLAVAALFQVVDGIQVVGVGVLRGLKDTRIPMLFAGLGYWVLGVPTGAWLAFGAGLGGIGIWLGLALGLAVVAALLLGRWVLRRRLGLVDFTAD